MKCMAPLLIGLAACGAGFAQGDAAAGNGRALRLSFADQATWHVHADAPWWALVDLRDMLSLFHPHVISETGKSAGATATVTLPPDFRPPFSLRFFCSDDYFADAQNHKPGQLGTESFFEHRLKQVLVDDQVVWEQDVADENTHGSPTVFIVDLTPHVSPGKPFRLTFRVHDRQATQERSDRDVWFIGGTWYTPGDGKTEEAPRFHTAVWFADPVVGEAAAVAAAPEGERPHDAVTIARHQARWPMAPPSGDVSFPARLQLVAPAAIPAPGFPLTCGVPLPPGALQDAGRLTLCDSAGGKLPLQAEPTGWWPDGSLRWATLNTIVPSGAAQATIYTLQTSDASAPTDTPLVVTAGGERVRVDTGALRVEMGGDRSVLLDRVVLSGRRVPSMRNMQVAMAVTREGAQQPVTATWQRVEVLERGPVRARVDLTGTLEADGQPIGRFCFRMYAYAGLPTLQVQFRIYCDAKPEPYEGTLKDAPLDVTALRLVAKVPEAAGVCRAGLADAPAYTAENGGLTVTQETAEHCTLSADGKPGAEERRVAGWIAADGVQAAVWRFWQQYPKALKLADGVLDLGLFTPTAAVPSYRPRFGEAKRHDVWLSFVPGASEQSLEAVGLLSQEPPRLFSGEWFCRSGGVARLDPQWFEHQPKLNEWVQTSYGDASCERYPGHFGIRNFGDAPYKVDPPQWLNGYWAMVQGTLNWGLASGSQAWLERSFEIARHIADVDAVHLPPDPPDWEAWDGMTCALGTDHSVHDGLSRWPAFQLGESLMLHHWMTGDVDSRAAALANADWIMRNTAGLGSSEARSQARPMLTLLRAWEATGDVRYRDAAKRYLDLGYQIENVIDWRRGAYIQPTYQNWRCISAGLDSMYAMNIYEYYRLTGDLDAARLVVAIADSVYAESMLPQEEGLGSFLFYVRYSRGSWYYTQMAILLHMAYDLTGDPRFLRAGRAAFARYLLSTNADGTPNYQPVHNFGWLDPEYGGWAEKFGSVPTEPFSIDSQTPDPDPARY